MSIQMSRLSVPAALVAAGFALAWAFLPAGPGTAQTRRPISSGLVSSDAARKQDDAWGQLRTAFDGETHGMKDMLVAYVDVKPGMEVHPPHQHAEEEFMTLTEGSGTWHLDGKEFPAKKGDVLYCAPWSVHGLKNTSNAPLTFFVVKWNNKGVEAPRAPAGAPTRQ